MGIVSIDIAYGTGSERNILVATLVFGASVAVVQFSAIALTDFIPGPPAIDAVIAGADVVAEEMVHDHRTHPSLPETGGCVASIDKITGKQIGRAHV